MLLSVIAVSIAMVVFVLVFVVVGAVSHVVLSVVGDGGVDARRTDTR